ncbi:MAG TPA: hypothetical protein VF707_10425 [Ardenticatenaceae bacterium]|jgi:metal-responsive CopG/Arc/MetJ family transcriptional regulator
MKTAVSIPNPIFEAAKQLAQQLGISRSELYSTALAAYVEEHHEEYVTERLNQLYSEEDSSLDPVMQQLQARSLPHEEW